MAGVRFPLNRGRVHIELQMRREHTVQMSRDAVEGLELLDLLGNLRPCRATISVGEYLLERVNL